VIFIETPVFTRQIYRLISEDRYRALQGWILDSPNIGEIIKGSGGCRKIRWAAKGKGKRGGIRVIYYWQKQRDQIFMLLAYSKNETSDLSRNQISILSELVKQEFGSN